MKVVVAHFNIASQYLAENIVENHEKVAGGAGLRAKN
jgi:hypothetical protein